MARGLNVFVNIGARVGSSVGSSARSVENRLAAIGKRARLAGAEMRAALKGVEEAQSARRGRILSGLSAAYVGAQALKPYVDFEDALVRMGNTAQVYGRPLERIGQQIQETGARFGYGGTAAVAGANDFIAAGLSMKTSMEALAPTLRLAKTAGVEVTEASQSGIAAMQNLGVRARDLGMAFDIMAKAGKEGRFEINDMARAFPGLSSRAKLLGMTGLDGVRRMSAMLQITRTNARDAEEAENNLLNFLDKLTGNETLQHFDKLGVSIEQVLKNSKRNGTDFVDDMLVEIRRLTKDGTDAIALTKLFPDRQARQAALALITQRKELERIKGVLNGGGISGTLAGDFGRIGKTSRFGLDRMWAGFERIGVSLGRAFGPMLGEMTERFAVFAERFAAWADKNPTIVRGVGMLAIAIKGLDTAFAGLGLVLRGPLMTRLSFFGKSLGRGLFGLATSGLGRLLAGLGPMALNGLAAVAPWLIRGLGMAFGVLTGPVGWAVLAASAGALIYKYRDSIAAGWSAVTGWFTNTAWPAIANTWRSIDWGRVGMFVADAMTFGLASRLPGLIEKARSIAAGVGIGSAGRPTPRINAPGRALGGRVFGGMPYTVGERGRELFMPREAGKILPAGKTSALLGMMEGKAPSFPMKIPVPANDGVSRGGAERAAVSVGQIVIQGGGQDPHEIAVVVRREINKLASGQSAYLND